MLQKEFLDNLIDAEVKTVWCHWNRLGALGTGKMNICSTDPEALILLTSIVGEDNQRLVSIMDDWLANYESLISIERLKRYIKVLNVDRDTSGNFEILKETISKQNTKRWRLVADLLGVEISKDKLLVDSKATSKKLDTHEKIIQRNLQLRLRLMFGAGTRADVIYFSLVAFNQPKKPIWFLSIPQISRMLHYNNSSIHRTVHDLELAGYLTIKPRKTTEKNKLYSLDVNKMGEITGGAFRWEVQNRYYIDWLKIVDVFLLTSRLTHELENVSDNSIIKSRLKDYIQSCSLLIDDSGINIEDTFSVKTYSALMHVGFDELQSRAISQIDGIYGFTTSGN